MAPLTAAGPPLVLHVVYRFDVGGLENGVVNLINHMPPQAYRHAVLALTEVAPAFAQRIRREGVQTIALHKPPGQGVWQYPKLWRIFRELRPAVVHTRNLAALEATVPAWAAGVRARVHGEHGRDGADLAAGNAGFARLRRPYRPFVSHYIALSGELAGCLRAMGVRDDRLSQVYNGVDAYKFTPAAGGPEAILGCPFSPDRHWLVGTVGRMQAVKDQLTLARAFVRALELAPDLGTRLRLVMVGAGPLKVEVMRTLSDAGVADRCWLPGERSDVAHVLRGLSAFVLPSRTEGISNVILEAMAAGLPVVATDVGGNPELVSPGRTGDIVPAADPEAMAAAIVSLARDPARAAALGRAARSEVESRFSMDSMVGAYRQLYDRLLARSASH